MWFVKLYGAPGGNSHWGPGQSLDPTFETSVPSQSQIHKMTALREELKHVSGNFSRNDCFLLPALTTVTLSCGWASLVMLLLVVSIKLQRERSQTVTQNTRCCFRALLHISLCRKLRLSPFCWDALGQGIWPHHPFSLYSVANSRRLWQLLDGNVANCKTLKQ